MGDISSSSSLNVTFKWWCCSQGLLCDACANQGTLLVARYEVWHFLVFVRMCHLCQIHQTRQIYILPTIALPAPLFSKMYMDTMIMPVSGQYRYIIQGRCSLSHYPEFHCLHKETAQTLGEWIFEDILCRWGSLVKIVTNNGFAFVAAINYLSKKYHINHICISGYNSRANGIAERPHFDVCQGLFKVSDDDQKKWS